MKRMKYLIILCPAADCSVVAPTIVWIFMVFILDLWG